MVSYGTIIENKMETTIVYWGYYWGYITLVTNILVLDSLSNDAIGYVKYTSQKDLAST